LSKILSSSPFSGFIFANNAFFFQDLHVSQLSGVMAIGVGDTFASIIGTNFGRLKWPGSKKTLEGTSAYIIFQLVGFYLLHLINVFDIYCSLNFLTVLLSILLSATVETCTHDDDNLLLSIITYPFLVTIK
jgi:dolichol kinase